MTTSIFERLNAIVRELLDLEESQHEIIRAEAPGWDSLNHLRIITALEDEFGVRFSEDEAARASSSRELGEIVATKLNARAT